MSKSSDLVFSTDSSVSQGKKKSSNRPKYQAASGPCRVRLEKKGRGGKQVTVLYNLPFEKSEAKALMKRLQKQFACGATFKDGIICLSGDFSEEVRKMIETKQLSPKAD